MADSNNTNGTAPPSGGDSTAPSSNVDIKDFLDFDPFEPPAGGQAKVPADEPATGASGDALPPSDAQQTQQQQPPDGAQAPGGEAPDPVLRELARINETLAAQQRQTPQYRIPQPPAGQSPAPRYNLQIPDKVLKAIIHSEDPEERAVGLAALVNGLANTIYNDVSKEFQAGQERVLQALPQMHQRLNVEQAEQQRAASDFFGRFQNLRPTPNLMRLVADEAKQLAVEMWHAGNRSLVWDENFREALGQRVHYSLGMPFPGRGPAPQPQIPPRAPKRPQFAAGSDAKGSNDRAAPSAEAKEIWDVFGY